MDRGLAVYHREGCPTCHSIAGTGNPRNPLDGVGDRWKPDELKQWIIGAGSVSESLPATIARRKQRYRSLPEPEFDALVSYLSTLKKPAAALQ